MPVSDQNIMCNQFTQALFALGDDVSSTTLKFIFSPVQLLYAASICFAKNGCNVFFYNGWYFVVFM